MPKYYSQEDINLTQQPVEKDGFSSDKFDKLYGSDKNPYINSERDRVRKKGDSMVSLNISQERWDSIFNNGSTKTNRNKKKKLGK